MNYKVICALLSGFVLMLGTHFAHAGEILPVENFFSIPSINDPELSPDGTKIAFLFPKDGRQALGLFDRATNEGRIVVESPDENITFFLWKGNERLVFGGDVNGSESLFIGATDLTGKKVQRLAESAREKDMTAIHGDLASLVSDLREDPQNILMQGVFFQDVPVYGSIGDNPIIYNETPEVLRINLYTKARTHLLAMHVEQDMGWGGVIADNAGVVRIAERVQFKDVVWQLRNDNNGSFREIARFPIHGYAESWEPWGFSADNKTLWLVSREEQDRGALYAYNTETKQRGPALYVPPEGEIVSVITGYHSTKLLGVAYETDKVYYHWFDEARGALQAKIEKTFKGSTCRLVSSSADEQVYLVRVSSDRDPGSYYILDLKHPALTPFKRIRPEIDPAKMQPMRPIAFTARDGLELHGYLTLPAGAEGKKVPLIINPHGGPFGVRDNWRYNPEVQFLANRGYAVLQVNYRGSGGYGREFINKGRYQWGRAMQDDLTDAVKWAIAQGIADPKRVAIYGGSYGGYAALAGITLTPDLYCCAVNYVGPADLAITFKERGGDAGMTSRDYNPQTAWVGETADYLAATSPINFVERIRVPTLNAYGKNDPRVDINHWYRLENQYKKYNKQYSVIIEKNQGHGFGNESARIHFYKEMDAFLAKYLAPAAP